MKTSKKKNVIINSGLPNRVLTDLLLILGCTFALFKHLLAAKQKQVILSSVSICRMHKMYSKRAKEVLFFFFFKRHCLSSSKFLESTLLTYCSCFLLIF